MHRKTIRGCHKSLSQTQQKVEELNSVNSQLDRELLELQVGVAERQQVEKLAGTIYIYSHVHNNTYMYIYTYTSTYIL